MKKVKLFSDGACSGNPGPGGWASILRYGSYEKEICGGDKATTNNRMELTAVIEGLKLLKEPCEVIVTSDSTYVVNAITKGWLWNWERKGWVKAENKPVPNADLWQILIPLLKTHKTKFAWIRGHSGFPENERCDQLAVEQTKIFKKG